MIEPRIIKLAGLTLTVVDDDGRPDVEHAVDLLASLIPDADPAILRKMAQELLEAPRDPS